MVVLGNTSADLDSFISALVFAYFYTKKANNSSQKVYVPLLNLTDVPSSDLWRLRPEYGTALRLAIYGMSDDKANKDTEKSLLQDLVTIADIRGDSNSSLHATFAANASSENHAAHKQDVVLVDHNAPQIPGLSLADLSSRLNLTGVIDHHVEENIVFAEASPRIVQTGIGSCTSLVVQHLRDEELWPAPSKGEEDHATLAKLALAPILIDTANLKATGDKVSDIDRNAVRFLESHITPSDPAFDRTALYNEVQKSKSNKLQLLTMDEIFESDYKEWTEQPSSASTPLNIGIASLVQDLPWLIGHTGSSAKLAEALKFFAMKTEHRLSLLCLITKGNGPNGEFRKELALVAYGQAAVKALEIFEEDAGELHLKEWKEDEGFGEALREIAQGEDVDTAYKVWWQGDVSKSRKQVAPLLREAVKKV